MDPDNERQSNTIALPASSAENAPVASGPTGSTPTESTPTESAELEPPPPQVFSIGPFSSQRAANEAALVLTSMGVPHQVSWSLGSPMLYVLAEDAARARRVLSQYRNENVGYPPRRAASRPLERGFPWLVVGFVALVAFFLQTGTAAHHSRWFTEGTSVASLVLTSEPYRAVTALTLHADASHVLGNALAGSVFGHMLSRRMGAGLATFTVVGAGILGNVANAAFYFVKGLPHASIGASTAVMAAIGALAAAQIVLGGASTGYEHTSHGKPAHKPSIWRYLAPLGAAVALLGLLGGNAASDIGAHGFGFAAGVGVGLLVAWMKRATSRLPRLGAGLQLAGGLLSVGVVAGAWLLALR